MIYGMYLSAAGVVSNSYRQDVIANNLANAETTGFKRDLPQFQQRLTEAQQRRLGGGPMAWSDPLLEGLGGGLLATPTRVDSRPGELEHTGSPLDVGIEGDGYFAVAGKDGTGPSFLTRDGRFMTDRDGYLILSNSTGQRVMDPSGKPIRLAGTGAVTVGSDGTITQNGTAAGRIGVFDVPDRAALTKRGGTLLAPPDANAIHAIPGTLRGEFVERSNVDPTTELTALMEAQRQLEANANMIRYQDQTLQKLVNEVGKIS